MDAVEDNRAQDSLSRLLEQNQQLIVLLEQQANEMLLMKSQFAVVVKLCEELRQMAGKPAKESRAERRARLEPVAIALIWSLGLNREAIARELNISESTLRGWTGTKGNSFEERLARARAVRDEELAQLAVGDESEWR